MTIPNGITFGDKVLVVPGYASGLTHSGNVTSVLERQNYIWVQRGDVIAKFSINGSFSEGFLAKLTSTRRHEAEIRSPVSGLLLHTELSHAMSSRLTGWNEMTEPPIAEMAFLLPDDEPEPESGRYMFSDMCTLARDMQHYYLKASRRWSMGPFSLKAFNDLLKLQMSANPRAFDAMPTWRDYFDEARTRKPELRPYLKHLR